MTSIERRIEVPGRAGDFDYQGQEFSEEDIAEERHRKFVGGNWEEIGQLQRDFLVEQGLKPQAKFIDVGCGAFRAGRHLVDYLDKGNYYGIDVNHDVIEAGYTSELDDAQRAALPEANLRSTDRFDADFGVRFDMGIAQSVFTHISLNLMRLCLWRVAAVMRPGGRFYVTFNQRRDDFPVDGISGSGKSTERNVFWYYRSDLRWAARKSPWSFRYIGNWGHPRGQKMVEYTRLEDSAD